ncbi:MAG: tetratricopeptide repeat protein [Nitrospina sp.]|jgi:tetratricopeptide (TPR) repeat protein|nr:tetratricopeptide repeat protein [Nitrospina sp.]MBT6716411.1 tetratricopeptide repeat protein [Nitrospina sp.]
MIKRYFKSFIFVLLAVFLSSCTNVPAPIDSHFNRGVEHYDNKDFAKAIEEYKLALRKNPKDTFALYNMGVVYQDQGKNDRAAEFYQDVLKHTEDTFSRINLASIDYSKGKKEEAFSQLKTAANKNPDSAHPLSVLGEFQELEGQLAEAEQTYLRALNIDSKHSASHYRLGKLLLKKQKYDQGVEHILKAVDLEPENPTYLEALGSEFERSGKLLEAANSMERVSVIEPDRFDLFVRLGDIYKKKKMYQEALTRYWSALAIKNDDPYTHRSVLEIYKSLSDMEIEKLKKLEGQSSFAQTQ